jgi:uncharacterized protein
MSHEQIPTLWVDTIMKSVEDDCACPDYAFLFTAEYSPTLENDCACPDTAYRAQPNLPTAPLYTPTADTHHQPLPANFHLLHSPFAPAGPAILNHAGWQEWQTFQDGRPLDPTNPLHQQLLEQTLLQPLGGRYTPTSTQGETLTAWLHITNACNLDCPYCYVRKSSARMSEATGLKAIRQIFYTAQQQGFKQVKLKYAGGEATLHFRLVKKLHEEAQMLAQQTGVGLREVVLSNGYHIRPADAEWLKEAGVKLMVSLDGVGDLHDQQRPLKNGGSTFDQIQHTVDEVLLPLGLTPDITITLTRLNAHGAAEAVRWCLERSLPISLNFYRPNLQSASRVELELEEQAIMAGMTAAYAAFEEQLPTRPFLNGLLDRVQAEAHTHTCGVQHSYLVITHTGQLSQCQMHLDQPVQPHLEGNLIPLVTAGTIQNISVDQKEGCRQCEFRYRCSGGCPLETYRATGRWDINSPHCRIYKTLWPQALRLEGLRLLKAHGIQSNGNAYS